MNEPVLLRTWAELGRAMRCARGKANASWAPVSRLISVARDKLTDDSKYLRELLAKSRSDFDPLDDPFNVDMGVHRWLAENREEAYSDWLEWIVKQIDSAESICRMFGLDKCSDAASWDSPTSVKREEVIDRGRPGHAGRLDVIVRFGKQAIILIEVKKGRAEDADRSKHPGYCKWLHDQEELEQHAVLLATENVLPLATESEPTKNDCFKFVPWRSVCLFLRRLASGYAKSHNCIIGAMILGFVGAVEQNLLGINASHLQRVVSGETVMFNPEIVDYLNFAILEQN
jgi:hypothetical protein